MAMPRISRPFAHEVIGNNYFDYKRECRFDAETLVLYEPDGNELAITTEDSSVRFLLVSGRPIREPVAWYGPIVMNTQEELKIAFEEFEKGTFIKDATAKGCRLILTGE
jgi:redox-sensitive bicupin YhaK (pirin superfamily)